MCPSVDVLPHRQRVSRRQGNVDHSRYLPASRSPLSPRMRDDSVILLENNANGLLTENVLVNVILLDGVCTLCIRAVNVIVFENEAAGMTSP